MQQSKNPTFGYLVSMMEAEFPDGVIDGIHHQFRGQGSISDRHMRKALQKRGYVFEDNSKTKSIEKDR